MSGTATRRDFKAVGRSRLRFTAFGMALSVAIFFFCTTSTVQAAITWSGEISPVDPTTWTSSINGYIGQSSFGTIAVDSGSGLLSNYCYLGYQASSSGIASVTGAGSKWTNGNDFFVGYSGNGTLNIESGAQVNFGRGYLGYNAGSNGTATVAGVGSKWTNTTSLYAGYYGNATLTIEAGGQVSNNTSYVGHYAGSNGEVTVRGTGSQWATNGYLYVGTFGNGTLTVADGGIVTVTSGLFASLNSLLGNGTISTNGGVLDADLVFDATHGLQNSIAFGTGGTLNIKSTATAHLGAGYKGNGTLRITEGIVASSKNGYVGYGAGANGTATVTGSGSQWINSNYSYVGYYGNGTLNIEAGGQFSNTDGYLGYFDGSSGIATITGAGSKWTNSGSLFVGRYGSGTLNVTDGGTVTVNKGLFASLNSLSGNGTISTNGGVLDAALVFDATHGLQNTYVFGDGGSLIFTQNQNSVLGVGYKNTGTLTIADGVVVPSSDGSLGYQSGSTGTATVTGAGSKWINSGALYVGRSGSGHIFVEAGGQVSNAKDGYVGNFDGAISTATVTGTGSQWANNSSLYVGVGGYGTGTLTVTDGGLVTVNKGIFASWNSLFGNGTISTHGGVLDTDLIFDATHGLERTFSFGTGGTLIFNQDGSGVLGAGYMGNGTLRIADGIAVASTDGYLGYLSSAVGTATVTDTGSTWINSGDLYVGYYGNATLTIEAGGQVSNADAYLGYFSSNPGSATVTGAGSKWLNNSSLIVGSNGDGTLFVKAGGEVNAQSSVIGAYRNSTSVATIRDANSKWTMSNLLTIGGRGNGSLNIEAGGQVSDTSCYLAQLSGSTGSATVTDMGSQWTNSNLLYIGYGGNGILNIEAGAQVSNSTGYVGYNPGATGMVKVTGNGSRWINNSSLVLGYLSSGALNITDNGIVLAHSLTLGNGSGGEGVLDINAGGMLQARNITRGSGFAFFNWNDGTIQNYDTYTNLSVSNKLVLKLAASGTHAFNIDAGRTGTIDAVLSDATTGGTLTKQGEGLLTLTGINIYSGRTTVEAGRFKVTGSILNTSGVDVSAGATLELAKTAGSATAGSLAIDNAGTVLISAGSQTVGAISGTGVTQVNAGTTLTATSIVQNSLSIGTAGVSGESAVNQVPEPGTMALLLLGAIGTLFAWAWRR